MVQSQLARFGRDQSGVAFIIFALMAGILIPVAGGALDYSHALTVRERLTAAADAAALAISRKGVKQQASASTTALALLEVNYPAARRKGDKLKQSVASSGDSPTADHIVRTADNLVTGTVTLSNDNTRISVEFSATVENLFLQIVGISTFPASVRAVASAAVPKCIYMRSFRIRGSLAIDGRCPFHVAGGKPGSTIAFETGSFANRGVVSVEGAYNLTGAYDNSTGPGEPSGELESNQPKATYNDPLAENPPAKPTLCGDVDEQVMVADGGEKTINPGTYCQSWELSGGTLKLESGMYVLREPINVGYAASGSIIEGDGVTLVFHDNGRIVIGKGERTDGHNAALIVCLDPPTAGIYKGLLIYQAKSADGNINRIDGSLDFSQEGSSDCPSVLPRKFRGIVYTPGMDYAINGAFAFKTSTTGVFVARDVYTPNIGVSIHFAVPAAAAPIILSGGRLVK